MTGPVRRFRKWWWTYDRGPMGPGLHDWLLFLPMLAVEAYYHFAFGESVVFDRSFYQSPEDLI